MTARYSYFILASLFIIMSACSVTETLIQTERPPDLKITPEIVKIAVIDRSQPSSGAINVLEGVVTGEVIGADRMGRQEVMRTFAGLMSDQNRFEVIMTTDQLPGSPSGANMTEPLTPEKVKVLINKYQADALLALESFDSDGRNYLTDLVGWTSGVGDPVPYPNNLRTGWRLYDGLDGRVLDVFETFQTDNGWWAYASVPPSAQFQAVGEGARSAAFQYAGRLIPVPVVYERQYFRDAPGAGDEMESAHRLVQGQRWHRAAGIWQEVYERSDKRRTRGRCAFNLAVASERAGDLDKAIYWAEEAITLGVDRAVNYSAMLTDMRDYQRWAEGQ